MSTTTMKLDDNAIRYITKGLLQPTEKSLDLMKAIGTKLQQNTDITFRTLGARDGHSRWLDYNKGRGHFPGGSTQYASGKWKKRIGTGSPKTSKRYSASSKMLQATGGFRKAWGVIQTEDKKLTYGVQNDWEDLAGNIIKDHGAVREVLFITDNEYEGYQRLALAWFIKNIKI
jgi:hypothetical protein